MRTLDIDTLHLDEGGHETPDDGLCLLEAVAYLAGEEHTDHPACVSPILGAFGRELNDRLGDVKRQQLKLLVPRLPDTAADGLDETRSYLALDWLIRTYAPAWLDLAGLSAEAAELRVLRRIVDLATAQKAGPVVRASADKAAAARDTAWAAAGADARDTAWGTAGAAAVDAARNTAWAAAQDAAVDAAVDATRNTAWNAAVDAALDAAVDAAVNVAWNVAGDAAVDAARAAARAAAGAAAWAAARAAAGAAARADAGATLRPTVETLQDSAIALFAQMIEVGR